MQHTTQLSPSKLVQARPGALTSELRRAGSSYRALSRASDLGLATLNKVNRGLPVRRSTLSAVAYALAPSPFEATRVLGRLLNGEQEAA